MTGLEPVQRAASPTKSAMPWHECSTLDCDYQGTDVLIEYLGDALAHLYGDEDPEYGSCGGGRFHYVYEMSTEDIYMLCGHPVAALGTRGTAIPPPGGACGPCMEILEHGLNSEALRGLRTIQAHARASQAVPPQLAGDSDPTLFIVEGGYE